MHPSAIAHQGILLTSDLARAGNEARQIQRASSNGSIRRIRRGAYVERASWDAAGANERYLLQLRAVAATRRIPPVFSLSSAAVLHGLPVLGPQSTMVHVSSPVPGHSRNGVAQHLVRPGSSTVTVGGLQCTSLVDTLADLAVTAGFASAVVSIDHALHSAARSALRPGEWILPGSDVAAAAAAALRESVRTVLETCAPVRGRRRALRIIDFATHLSDSPGESVSRANIHLLGFPPPELQHPFFDYLGRIGWGDFWWEHLRLLGEFDGENKYTNPQFLAGRTSAQAVIDEKWREDRIRATDAGVSRWGWSTAIDLNALYAKLSNAGLRPVSARPKAL
jgi:predicted transcriptional regulator of viral defense system